MSTSQRRAGTPRAPCAGSAQHARALLCYVDPMEAELEQIDGRPLIGRRRDERLPGVNKPLCTLVLAAGASVLGACMTVSARPIAGLTTLAGRLVPGDQPASGVSIEVRAAGLDPLEVRTVTAAGGSFGPLSVRPGLYDIELHPPEGPFQQLLNIGILSGQHRTLNEIDLSRFDQDRGAVLHLRGKVQDTQGHPLSQATVAIWESLIHFGRPGEPARVHTDVDGRFAITTSERADVSLEAEKQGRVSGVVEVPHFRPARGMALGQAEVVLIVGDAAPPSSVHPLEWSQRRTLISSGPSGTLTGAIVSRCATAQLALLRLLDKQNPPPVRPQAQAWAGNLCLDCAHLPLPWESYFFAGGAFEIPRAATGRSYLRAKCDDRTALVAVDVADGGRTDATLTLEGTSSLRVRFLRPGGHPFIFGTVCVELEEFSGESLSCSPTDDDGTAHIDGATPGRRRVTVRDDVPQETRPPITIELRDGQLVDLGTIQLESIGYER